MPGLCSHQRTLHHVVWSMATHKSLRYLHVLSSPFFASLGVSRGCSWLSLCRGLCSCPICCCTTMEALWLILHSFIMNKCILGLQFFPSSSFSWAEPGIVVNHLPSVHHLFIDHRLESLQQICIRSLESSVILQHSKTDCSSYFLWRIVLLLWCHTPYHMMEGLIGILCVALFTASKKLFISKSIKEWLNYFNHWRGEGFFDRLVIFLLVCHVSLVATPRLRTFGQSSCCGFSTVLP